MVNLTKLKLNYNFNVSPEKKEYLNPERIYLPIYDNYQIMVKDKQSVKKSERILKGEKNSPIFSPVSGTIVGKTEKMKYNNKKLATIVIDNNYKEESLSKMASVKDIKKIDKKDFLDTLINIGVLNSENDQVLLKDKFDINKTPKCIVLKAFDDEPFIENARFILEEYMENILYTLDALLSIFASEEGFILLKEKNSDIIMKYKDFLGTFPKLNIKLIEDVYPLFDDELLINKVFKIPKKTNSNIIILSLEDILNIYNAIKRKRQTIEKFITITGNALENPSVIKVKIGTKLIDIINNCIKLNTDNVVYFANGFLRGKEVKNLNELIVTNDFKGLIINKKENIKSIKCINCGKCYKICPKRIDPRNINKEKCIECGLCTYICPSKIKLLEKEGYR